MTRGWLQRLKSDQGVQPKQMNGGPRWSQRRYNYYRYAWLEMKVGSVCGARKGELWAQMRDPKSLGRIKEGGGHYEQNMKVETSMPRKQQQKEKK